MARLNPYSKESCSLGLMAGSVLRYDDPFEPALDPDEWEANR